MPATAGCHGAFECSLHAAQLTMLLMTAERGETGSWVGSDRVGVGSGRVVGGRVWVGSSSRCEVGSRCGSLTLRCGRGARRCVSKRMNE